MVGLFAPSHLGTGVGFPGGGGIGGAHQVGLSLQPSSLTAAVAGVGSPAPGEATKLVKKAPLTATIQVPKKKKKKKAKEKSLVEAGI